MNRSKTKAFDPVQTFRENSRSFRFREEISPSFETFILSILSIMRFCILLRPGSPSGQGLSDYKTLGEYQRELLEKFPKFSS